MSGWITAYVAFGVIWFTLALVYWAVAYDLKNDAHGASDDTIRKGARAVLITPIWPVGACIIAYKCASAIVRTAELGR